MQGITHIDYYIPENEMSTADFLDSIDGNAIPPTFKDKPEFRMFVENILKLKGIRVENQLDEAGMIGVPIERLFDSGRVKPGDIDILISTQEPIQVTQLNLAKYLQYTHKMSNAYVMELTGNHCANIEVAIMTAASILESQEDVRNILIVTSNKTQEVPKRIYGSYAVLGDAAGIVLMSKTVPPAAPYPLYLKDKIIVSSGKLHNADVNDDNSLAHCISYVKCISDLVNKNNITSDKLERILIQNANPLMITQCMASAGLDKKKIFTQNLGRYGHMDYADFPINLKDILDSGIEDRNRYILTFGTGTTGSYIACLFGFNEES